MNYKIGRGTVTITKLPNKQKWGCQDEMVLVWLEPARHYIRFIELM